MVDISILTVDPEIPTVPHGDVPTVPRASDQDSVATKWASCPRSGTVQAMG